MKNLLLEIKETVEEAKPIANQLTPAQLESFEERYEQIIKKGLPWKFSPHPFMIKLKDGAGKSKTRLKTWLNRLKKYSRETLAFMYDFNLPFDNNQAKKKYQDDEG